MEEWLTESYIFDMISDIIRAIPTEYPEAILVPVDSYTIEVYSDCSADVRLSTEIRTWLDDHLSYTVEKKGYFYNFTNPFSYSSDVDMTFTIYLPIIKFTSNADWMVYKLRWL